MYFESENGKAEFLCGSAFAKAASDVASPDSKPDVGVATISDQWLILDGSDFLPKGYRELNGLNRTLSET